jgi:phage-related protein
MAETTVASGKAVIRPELQNGFANKIRSDLNKESGGIASTFGSLGKNIGATFAAGFAAVGTAAVAFGVKGVMAASDVEEAMSKVNVVFGDGGQAVVDWSKTSAEALGMSQGQALEAAGTYGNLFTAMGIGQKQAQGMSTELVGLAADLASFNNASPEETLNALRAGLSGETEPLKRFGVNINQAAIEAQALNMGLMQQGGELSAAAKAQATYALVMQQTTNAQGDFARTSGGVANQMRIMKAEFENTAATVGQTLMPLVSAGAGAIRELIGGISEPLGRVAAVIGEALTPLISTLAPILSQLLGTVAGVFEQILPPIVNALNQAFTAIGPVLNEILGVLGEALVALLPLLDPIVQIITLVAEVASGVLVPIIKVLVTILSEVLAILAPIISSLIEGLKPAFDAIIGVIAQIDWTPLIEAFKTIATVVGEVMLVFGDLIGQLLTALMPILPVLIEVFMVIATTLADLASQVLMSLLEAIKPIIPPIIELVKTLVGGLAGILPKIAELLMKLVEAVMPLLPAIMQLVGSLLPIFVDLLNLLAPILVWLVETAVNLLSGALTWLIDNAITPLIDILVVVIGWISEHLGPILQWLGEKAVEVWGWISEAVMNAWNNFLKPIWDAIYGFIVNFLVPYFQFLWETVNTVWGWISGAISTAWGVVSGVFEHIKNGIGIVAGFISEKVGAIVGFFTDLKDKITGAVSGLWDGFMNAAKGAFNWIADLWNNTVGKIEFDIPEWVPVVGGNTFGLPDIPKFEESIPAFADGGVITEPTIGLMGETAEARPEIVTPEALMRDVFSEVLNASGPSGQIVNNFQTQRYSVAELADEVAYRQARQLTGRAR